MGGEEFAILVPDADEDGAVALAERLRIAVATEFSESESPLTVSCGIAVYRPGGRLAVDLFDAADRALYVAKESGRDRVEVSEYVRPALELATTSR
jgi:diguanylate cyclase (GGDEF)-like protein